MDVRKILYGIETMYGGKTTNSGQGGGGGEFYAP